MPKACAALFIPALFAFSSHAPPPDAIATYEFGFSLNTEQYFIYKVFEGAVIESDPITLKSFVLQASGKETSRANPEGRDLFELYEIANCSDYVDSTSMRSEVFCPALTDLWKLRYGGATSGTATAGWAGEVFAPSIRQQILLQAYRSPAHEHWLGPYFGKQAFMLLHDMQDPTWVASYRRSG